MNQSIPVAAMGLTWLKPTGTAIGTDTKVHKLQQWVKKAGKTLNS
jgi:hypothetical protein